MSRPHPVTPWQSTEVPHLAVISRELSMQPRSERKRAVGRTPASSGDRNTCCPGCYAAELAVPECQPMGRTNLAACGFAVRRRTRTAPVRIRGHSISTQSRPRCSRASRPEMRSALSRSGKALGLVSQGPVIAIKRPRSWPALNGALDPSRKRRTGHKTEDILYYSPRARPSLQSVVRLWSCCALSSSKTISAPLTMKSRKSKQALC